MVSQDIFQDIQLHTSSIKTRTNKYKTNVNNSNKNNRKEKCIEVKLKQNRFIQWTEDDSSMKSQNICDKISA